MRLSSYLFNTLCWARVKWQCFRLKLKRSSKPQASENKKEWKQQTLCFSLPKTNSSSNCDSSVVADIGKIQFDSFEKLHVADAYAIFLVVETPVHSPSTVSIVSSASDKCETQNKSLIPGTSNSTICKFPVIIWTVYKSELHKLIHFIATSSQNGPSDITITPVGHCFVKPNFKLFGQFPKDDTNRCFQPSWADKFGWLEYSKEQNAVFCFPSRQFSHCIKSDSVFVKQGFSKWRAALQTDRGFAKHEKSAAHLSSMVAWNEQTTRSDLNKDVSSLLSKDVLEMRRYYVQSIIGVMQFLIENELWLRGNWDALDGAEDGTFVNLFKCTLDKDQQLKTCNA